MSAPRILGCLGGRSATGRLVRAEPRRLLGGPHKGRSQAKDPGHVDPVLGVPGFRDAQRIGAGSSSVVYRAYQEAFDRVVAVKVLTGASGDPTILRTFQRSCEIAGRLAGHPNIARVFSSGTTAKQHPYLVMDYFERGSLAETLRTSGPLSVEEVLNLGVRLAGALESAHRDGIVHGNVKPENVLRSRYGVALTDFGLAQPGMPIMAPGVAWPIHLPPEVLDGKTPTPASDVYSLGSTLHAALSGRAAFTKGESEARLAAHVRVLRDDPPPVGRGDVPIEVEAVLDAAMAKEPGRRPISAAAFGEQLRQLQVFLGQTPTDPVTIPGSATGAIGAAPSPAPPPPWAPDPGVPASPAPAPPAPEPRIPTVLVDRSSSGAAPRPRHPETPAPPRGRGHSLNATTLRKLTQDLPMKKVGLVAIAVALIASVAGIVFTRTPSAPTTVSYAFAPTLYPSGLAVSRTWQLTGQGGSRLTAEVLVANTLTSAVTATVDEVIPKSVAANVSAVSFHPAPSAIVQQDPIVSYQVTGLAPAASMSFSYGVALPGNVVSASRLQALAADQDMALAAFGRSTGPGAPLTLATLSVQPQSLQLQVGEKAALTVTGTMSDGSPAPAALTAAVPWQSSAPQVARINNEAQVEGVGPGSARLVAQAGSASASVAVVVTGPPAATASPTARVPTNALGHTAASPSHSASGAPSPPRTGASPSPGGLATAGPSPNGPSPTGSGTMASSPSPSGNSLAQASPSPTGQNQTGPSPTPTPMTSPSPAPSPSPQAPTVRITSTQLGSDPRIITVNFSVTANGNSIASCHVVITGIIDQAGSCGSISVSAPNYSTSYDVYAYVTTAGGLTGTSAHVTVTTGPPPPPSQSIQIGWSSAHPSWIILTMSSFPTGSYVYTCNFASGGNQSFTLTESSEPETWDNGHTCFDTIAGDRVWVTVGSVTSNTLIVP
jgi:serine/threonine-protein kinase PknK